jgi:hypothetical protein
MLDNLKFWRRRPYVIYNTLPPRKILPMYLEEIREVRTVALSGDNIILDPQVKYDIQVIGVTIQPSAAVSAALKEKNFFMSPFWNLAALQFWSAPGKIVDRNHPLILNLSAAVSTVVEVRWRPYFRREYRPEW